MPTRPFAGMTQIRFKGFGFYAISALTGHPSVATCYTSFTFWLQRRRTKNHRTWWHCHLL